MKHPALVFLLVLIAGTSAFAEGSREVERPELAGEIVSLTGTIELSMNPPVLQSGGEEYLVMVPRAYQSEIAVEDGAQVTLEGYVHEGFGRNTADQQVISVTRAIIDGNEYDVESYRQTGAVAQGPRFDSGRGRDSQRRGSSRGPAGKTGPGGRR
jgi:hypothetical protein